MYYYLHLSEEATEQNSTNKLFEVKELGSGQIRMRDPGSSGQEQMFLTTVLHVDFILAQYFSSSKYWPQFIIIFIFILSSQKFNLIMKRDHASLALYYISSVWHILGTQ